MANNISKYLQLNDFLLLEYEFNRDNTLISLSSLEPVFAINTFGTKQFYNNNIQNSTGITNNNLLLYSQPLNSKRSQWVLDVSTPNLLHQWIDSSIALSTASYQHDTVKLHMVSGYNFDDIPGFLLQIGAKDDSTNLVDLCNFTWVKQVLGSTDVIKFALDTLLLGNKFYDKYIEFKVPSPYHLGTNRTNDLENSLAIASLSDVYITFSTINAVTNNQYTLTNELKTQLPVISPADNFNAYIAESGAGDFIEYYATWANKIIGTYMADIESGRIPLYTSSNPNDNAEEFSSIYGINANKWVLMHEITVYEHIPGPSGGTTLQTQKFNFTQNDSFSSPNYFRPILKYSDVISSYSIVYIVRLMNRMDGTQIIRKASFASTNISKYGRYLQQLNVSNILPLKVYNKLEAEKPNIVNSSEISNTSYVKIYYDVTNVVLDQNNTVYSQGTGPLYIKSSDSYYLFNFKRIKDSGDKTPVDLSGFKYDLVFKLDNNAKIEIPCTFSTNMNTILGQLEFMITEEQSSLLLSQINNSYSIRITNPDMSKFTYYQGIYLNYNERN